jgi:hypothetical protein
MVLRELLLKKKANACEIRLSSYKNLMLKPLRKCKKNFRNTIILCVSLFGLTISVNVNADISWFSRANCFNNESITWHLFNPEWLWTASNHYRNGVLLHCNDSAGYRCRQGSVWELTSWSGVVHWGEGTQGGFMVLGHHHRWNSEEGAHLLGSTRATGCNPTHF